MNKCFCAIFLFLFIISGCAPLISKELRNNASNELTFKEIIKEPDVHKGKIVLISGIILGSKNTGKGTLIEILQKPADMLGKPKDTDESDGRFLALKNGYLDTAIYSREREVIVAGEVKGKRTLPLGEIKYDYPLIMIREIHLFKPEKEKNFYTYPYPHWYYPYWYPW